MITGACFTWRGSSDWPGTMTELTIGVMGVDMRSSTDARRSMGVCTDTV